MKKWAKRAMFWVGLLVVCAGFAMEPEKPDCKKSNAVVKKRRRHLKVPVNVEPKIMGEQTCLYKLVTAERLNYKELYEYLSYSTQWINEPDGEGCTPLYHVIKHQYTKVDLVRFFIEHGARLDIKNKYEEDPYKFGVCEFDDVFEGDKRKVGQSNRKQVL